MQTSVCIEGHQECLKVIMMVRIEEVLKGKKIPERERKTLMSLKSDYDLFHISEILGNKVIKEQ